MATSSLSVVPPLLQLEPKHQAAMRSLISTVVRSFYEPKFFILMELLAKHHIFRDDELAGRVGLNVKDLNRLMAILHQHRLVQAYRQNEMKENQGRIVGKAYFYIDPQKFCNVIKWRISDMRNQIDNSLKAELDNKGYICPLCTKSYTALEVDQVFDFVRNILACDVCGTELVDNENSEKVKGSKDRMQRFNAQMKYIRDGLRNIEGVVMPAFDVSRYVREKMAAEKAMGVMDDDGLKVATGAGKAQQVEIHMVEDEDEDQKKKERQKNAEEKRRQNAMPAWHTNSTISGEKTALGIKADERSSNDALLAAAEAQAKAAEAKAASYDTFDTEEYYDNLINGGEDSPRGMKRKLEEAEHNDGRQMKMARRDDGQPVWGAPGGGYPGMPPGMPYGYPPHMPPMGQQNGMAGRPNGHPMYPPMPASTSYYRNPTPSPAQPFTSQSSAGTSRNTPSQASDSDSSQDPQREPGPSVGGLPGSSAYSMSTKKKKPSLNGLEKRVSFAEVVSERSPSPPPASEAMSEATPQKTSAAADDYNPIVKVGGKDVRARDVKDGDDELMTADEFEAYWLIKERIDEIDAAA